MKKNILLNILFLILLFGCKPTKYDNKFEKGDIVTHKVSKLLEGQVIFIYYHYSPPKYDVRWVIHSIRTNTNVLSEDELFIGTYFLTKKMNEFELEKVNHN